MDKWLMALCLLAPLAWAEQASDGEGKPCEETVDLAERGQFHRLHFECSKAAESDTPDAGTAAAAGVVSAEPAAQAAGQAQLPPVTGPATAGAQAHEAISAPQANWQALAQVQNSLFQTMSNQCPAGWRKLGEWVTGDAAGYRIHYSYNCL